MSSQTERAKPYIPYYIHQFGRIRFKGANFLIHILTHYVMTRESLDDIDYKQLISKVADEKEVTPNALRQAIKRYIEDGWKQGFDWEWKKYTGWSADTPPDPNTAIQLLCESFFDFIKNYETLIQESGSFYLRNAIENREEHLKSILSEDDMIVSSHLYMTFEDKNELDAYVCYLTYRVQRDLYEVGKKSGQFGELSWREFVWDVRHKKRVRDAAAVVARETLKDFRSKGRFDFDVKEVKLILDSDIKDGSGSDIYSSQLFSVEEGRALVESILLTAEVVQYKRQLAEGKGYSWEYFLAEMSENPSLWDETLMAFRDALMKLDFKPLWQSEQLEQLVNRQSL